MYCRSCSAEIADEAVMCVKCGVPTNKGNKFCQHCGKNATPEQAICLNCGVKLKVVSGNDDRWLITLLLAIFVGWFGIHRFYTGHTKIGIIQLFTFGGFYVWTILDIIKIITGKFEDSEGNLIQRNV